MSRPPALSAPRTNSGSAPSRDTLILTAEKSASNGKNHTPSTSSTRRSQQGNVRIGSGSNDGKSQRSGMSTEDKAAAYEDAACSFLYPLLSPNQLREIRNIFNYYVNNYADEPSTAAVSEKSASRDDESGEHRGPAPAARSPLMNVRALMAFFADIEMPKTNYEVRDLIASMMQPESSVANSKQGMQDADAGSFRDVDSTSGVATEMYPDRKPPGTEQGVSFMHFLHLFCTVRDAPSQLPLSTLQKPNSSAEAGSTLAGKSRAVDEDILDVFRMADADRDGAISVADVWTLVNGLLGDGHVCDEVQQLARMEPAELRVALGELDVDGDGIVTESDFRMVMQTM